MIKSWMKPVVLLLAAFCVLLPLQVTAQASGCELVVSLLDAQDAPVPGITVELLQVAAGAGASAVLTDGFDGAGCSAAQLAENSGAEQARQLYRHVLEQNLSGQVAVSSATGELGFSGLAQGLYLVFERGGQTVTFLPYLVWLSEPITVSAPKTEESGSVNLRVAVVWDDGNDADGLRPGTVTVTLFRDSASYRKVLLSLANGWQHTFVNLPNDGVYTVEQTAVPGYTTTYSSLADGFLITNCHENTAPDALATSVEKVWEDTGSGRPVSITVQLIEADTVMKTAVLSAENSWKTEFSGLNSGGEYSVREIAVAGYTASYSGNVEDGFVVTNTASADPDVPPGGDPSDPTEPTPDGPEIPQTGFYTWPVYLLLTLGILLVLLGTVLLLREAREE